MASSNANAYATLSNMTLLDDAEAPPERPADLHTTLSKGTFHCRAWNLVRLYRIRRIAQELEKAFMPVAMHGS